MALICYDFLKTQPYRLKYFQLNIVYNVPLFQTSAFVESGGLLCLAKFILCKIGTC